jgi:ATP-dependent exoDNAse (exonuclease V) beta subunit
LKNTRQDANFDWLFKHRQSTQVEAEFMHQGNSVIIDRLFIDKNILWVVDFKTADRMADETDEMYVKRQQIKHTKQLKFYKEVLAHAYNNEIKCALYCPSVSQLIEIKT